MKWMDFSHKLVIRRRTDFFSVRLCLKCYTTVWSRVTKKSVPIHSTANQTSIDMTSILETLEKLKSVAGLNCGPNLGINVSNPSPIHSNTEKLDFKKNFAIKTYFNIFSTDLSTICCQVRCLVSLLSCVKVHLCLHMKNSWDFKFLL